MQSLLYIYLNTNLYYYNNIQFLNPIYNTFVLNYLKLIYFLLGEFAGLAGLNKKPITQFYRTCGKIG
jgi:hypothetical protein